MDYNLKNRYLYFLSKKECGTIFYIGITQDPRIRYRSHIVKFGININMCVFKELKTFNDACIESYVILNAIKIGFNLINNTRVLCYPYIYTETNSSFDSFIMSACGFNELKEINGIKFMPQINQSILETPSLNVIKINLGITEKINEGLMKQSKIQLRSMSNLVRQYILEGLKRDEEVKKS